MDAKEIKKSEATEKSGASEVPAKNRGRDKRLAVLVCGSALLVLIGLCAGLWVRYDYMSDHRLAEPKLGMMPDSGFAHSHPHAGLEQGVDVNPTDGTKVTRLTGVVTQVGSDSFTIAGNGTTKTIKINSDTDYNTADKKVNVNDTVLVSGTDSNGTFTATSVIVANANQ